MAAIGKLFDYKHVIICDKELSDEDAIRKVIDMYNICLLYTSRCV